MRVHVRVVLQMYGVYGRRVLAAGSYVRRVKALCVTCLWGL